MNAEQTISVPSDAASPRARGWHAQIADDKAMLRAARDLTKDISDHRAAIYWTDMVGSALLGYGSLAAAILVESAALAAGLAALSVLSLYRALLFIHEISHFRNGALPGFRTGWNALVGVPMLTPSFMYEQVHTLHHKRTQYGTVEDPEYLPLALMNAWSLPVFVIVAILAPVALLFRFAVLVPLGAIIPPLRRLVWERASALAINPEFRRRAPEGDLRPRVLLLETVGALWAWVLIGSVMVLGWKPLLMALGVASVVALLNQLRTLVAHLWENEGEAMTVTAQFLDSVNVPPPGRIAEIWAPVGLRYHALHHLMPSMPYHSLPEAHRRLVKELGAQSTYHGANHAGMSVLVARIARSTMGRRG